MVLKLYGHPLSTSTQRAAITLHEKQVPFELVLVDFTKGEQKAPEYVEKHPFGQIPLIDDDGFIVYESRAISRYIATKHAGQGPKLIPTDLKGNTLFEQAASAELANFDYYALKAAWEKAFKKLFIGLDTDEALLKSYLDTLNPTLDAYEKILSKQKYLAGDKITLVDLFHLPGGDKLYASGQGDLIDKRPNVKRWWDDITSRPSWQAVKTEVKSTA